jgi:hypothetical protein
VIRILVLVPVLNRPQAVAPLVESLAASMRHPTVTADLLFICSPGDTAENNAVDDAALAADDSVYVTALVVDWQPGAGDYARKMNYGWKHARDGWEGHDPFDYVLLGADDLVFHPGWAEQAVAEQLRSGACVVGTNDLGNRSVMRGLHATHPLVHTGYTCGLVDNPDPDMLLNTAYDHSYVDNEFVGTAKLRGTFQPCVESVVEHLHPFWGKSKRDGTYDKGARRMHEDQRLWMQRRHLWEGPGR